MCFIKGLNKFFFSFYIKKLRNNDKISIMKDDFVILLLTFEFSDS